MLGKIRRTIRAIYSIQSKIDSLDERLATIEHNETRLLEGVAEIRQMAAESAELPTLLRQLTNASAGSNISSGMTRFSYQDFIGSFGDHTRPPSVVHLGSTLCQQEDFSSNTKGDPPALPGRQSKFDISGGRAPAVHR
jgi:hypothetical protein